MSATLGEMTASRVAWHFKRAGLKKMGRNTILRLASSGWCGARKVERKGSIGFYYLLDGVKVQEEIAKMKDEIAKKLEEKRKLEEAKNEVVREERKKLKGDLFDPGRKEHFETITIDSRLKRVIVDRATRKGVPIGRECSALVQAAISIVGLIEAGKVPELK